MSGSRIYLDCNASECLRPEARAAMVAALEVGGNASSVHAEGRRARAVVEKAREEVAALVNARPSEIVFTSGATEANCAVMAAPWDTIVLAAIEHESVLAPARASAARRIEVALRAGDAVTAFADAMQSRTSGADDGRGLVVLQTANNETGTVYPVAEVAERARSQGFMVHTDAVQSAGRMALDFAALGADTMSLSSHKMGGPKGVGALVVRDGVTLPSFVKGGGQERRRRAGTENVAAIAGFGAAAEAARLGLVGVGRLADLRDRLERAVAATAARTVVVGADGPRLPNTSCLALPGHLAETMVIKLDLAGFAVSAGSACSSGKVGVSHVLTALGLPSEVVRGAVRVSLGWQTTAADIDAFAAAWAALAGGGEMAA